jgi:hypothetical protein
MINHYSNVIFLVLLPIFTLVNCSENSEAEYINKIETGVFDGKYVDDVNVDNTLINQLLVVDKDTSIYKCYKSDSDSNVFYQEFKFKFNEPIYNDRVTDSILNYYSKTRFVIIKRNIKTKDIISVMVNEEDLQIEKEDFFSFELDSCEKKINNFSWDFSGGA